MTGNKSKRNLKLVLFGIYLSFILISAITYLAEEQISRGKLSAEFYESHLVFPSDGEYGHYKSVVLIDKNSPGKIDLKYTFETNTLLIERAENIKELAIDCQLMYNNKYEEIFEDDLANHDADYYKTYFKETNNGVFSVIVNSDKPMEKLTFINAPSPRSVLVDYQKADEQKIENEEWWGTKTYYSQNGNDITISYIPVGSTTVTIIFKEGLGKSPKAAFTFSTNNAIVNKEIYFNGSNSSDEDGEIIYYLWDFGDGTQFSGEDYLATHTYTELGNYTIKLTVRDNDYLEDSKSKTIFVIHEGLDSDSDGVVNELDPNPYIYEDTDKDGLSNDYEIVISKTDPGNKDTDGDGWDDGDEVDAGTSPTDATDHPKRAGEKSSDMSGIIISVVIIIIVIIMLIFIIIFKKKKKPAEVEAIEEEPVKKKSVKELPRAPSKIRIQQPPILKPVKETKIPIRKPVGMKQEEILDTFDHVPAKSFRPVLTKMPRRDVPVHETRPVTIPVTSPAPAHPYKKTLVKLPVRKPSIKEPPVEKTRVEEPPEKMPSTPPKPKIIPLKPRIIPQLEEESPAMYRENTVKDIMKELSLGRATAELLFDGGFSSVTQLKKASKRGLMTVKGVGPKLANKIIKTREKLK